MFCSDTEYSARFFLVAKINVSHCRDLFVPLINFFFAMIKFCNKRLTASKTFKERTNITEPENRTGTLEQNHKKTQISTAKTKNKSH